MNRSTSTTLPSTPMITTLDLFGKSFLFIRDNAKKIFYIILIMLVPRLIIQITNLWLFYQIDEKKFPSDFRALFFFFFFPTLILISIIISLLGSIALLLFINENNPNLKITEAYKEGLKKFFSYLWIAILSALIVIGGLILFVIPGIIWTISYSLGIYVLIAENLKGYQALKRSKELVKNYWWPVFLRYINLFLFMIVLVLPLLIIESVIKSKEILLWVNFSYEIIYSFIIIAFSTVYSFYIYKDLRRIKGY